MKETTKMPTTTVSLVAPEAGDQLILASLEPEQLTGAKRQRLPRRRLKGSEVLLLWSLRVYLLFMVGVVVYQLWRFAR
jgi:hypothetical protein